MRRLVPAVVLLFLAAMYALPVAQAGETETGAACRALLWLRTQQLPDGGFGLAQPGGGYRTSASITADVVYATALLGEDPTGPRWSVNGNSALDALEALAPSYVGADAGQAGKVTRAVVVAGGNPGDFGGIDLIAVIQEAYDASTGRYHPSFAYRHTLAVEALLRSGRSVPQAAFDALLEDQQPEGGWFWGFDAQQSDVDSTGRVLQLLAGLAGLQEGESYVRAADYLAATQLPAGGWNVGYLEGPANANSTALAVAGLQAAGFSPDEPRFVKAGRSAIETLLTFQEASGAFVYIREEGKQEVRLMATADALVALAPHVSQRPVCRSTYLPLLLAM